MARPTLLIANKNYSTWSLRAWIGLRAKGIDFEESLQVFDVEHRNPHFKKFSPTGKVPVLVDGDLTVWESLAILEYIADKHPEARLWPEDRAQRAIARSVSNEMHAGFFDLRSTCSMDIQREPASISISDGIAKDVGRIEEIWSRCLEQSGGPFLFGDFSIADAMYAPVISRFATYKLSDSADASRYAQAVCDLDAWKEWDAAARAETWTVKIAKVPG